MTYIWQQRRKRKIHIENRYGNSFCRAEHNGKKTAQRMKFSSPTPPPGRDICKICIQLMEAKDHRPITRRGHQTRNRNSAPMRPLGT